MSLTITMGSSTYVNKQLMQIHFNCDNNYYFKKFFDTLMLVTNRIENCSVESFFDISVPEQLLLQKNSTLF